MANDEDAEGGAVEVPSEWSRRATDRLDWSSRPVAERAVSAAEPGADRGNTRATSAGRGGLLRMAAVGLACAVVGGLVGGFVVRQANDGVGASAALPTARPAGATTIATTGNPVASGVADIVARARPAIVKIESTRKGTAGIEHDVGSGVLVDRAGHIVTNAHVVLGTETLKVFLSDGSEQPAILLGHDWPFNDVAVLQIGPPAGLQPVAIGDSTKLQLGETVVALGNPLAEFDGSVTIGIVSGLGRKRSFDGVRQDDLIQSDAALNNGNSGGALLNARGEFIGMPTAVLRQNRGGQPVEGIGFSIPANRVMAVAQGIITARASLARPTLGIDHLDLSPDASVRGCRVNVEDGAVVVSVVAGGPGALAGMQPCDVITKLGSDPVDRDHLLLNGLASHSVGEALKVVLNRNGRIIEVEVRLVKRG